MSNVSQDTVGIRLQVTGAQALAAEFKKATAGVEKFQAGLKSTLGALAGIGTAFISFHALSGFFKAAQESAVATAQLEQALQSTGEGASVAASEFTDLADELQNLTGFTDEAIQDVSRLILQFTQSAELAKKFTPIVLDLAAAMGTDAASAAQQLGRALAGETITVRGLNIQASSAEELFQKLSQRFGGTAEAAMRAKGPLAAVAVQLGEVAEGIGKILITATGGFFENLAKGLKTLNEELKTFAKENESFLLFLRDAGGAVGKLAAENIEAIAIALGALAGAAGVRALIALVPALEAIAPIVLAIASALVVLGAAYLGVRLLFDFEGMKKWVGGLQGVGAAIRDNLTLAFEEARLAGLRMKAVLFPFADFSGEIAETEGRIKALIKQIKAAQKVRSAPAPEAAPAGPIAASRESILKAQLELQEANAKLATTDSSRLNFLGAQLRILEEMERIVEEQTKLRREALGNIPFNVTEEELARRKKLLEIDTKRRAAQQDFINAQRQESGKTFAGSAALNFEKFQESRKIEAKQGLGGLGPGALAGVQNSMIQLGTTAQQVGDAISSAIGGAVNGIAAGIEGLIKGTLTWHQAIVQVGEAILDSIVKAISEMIAKMLVSFALQLAFEPVIAASAAALAEAWAAPALFASVATEGTAVGVGVAALSSGLATTVALGSFEKGGFTGTGPRDQPAGIVHRGEYVVPAESVSRLGLDWFEAAAAGVAPSAPGSDPAGGQRAINQNLNVFLDRRAWIAASRDDIEAIAIDAVARSRWRVHA